MWSGGAALQVHREDLINGEALSGKNPVQTFKRKGSLPVQEVRDMRLTKSSLPRQASSCQGSGFDSTNEFQAEKFVEVCEVQKIALQR